MSSAMEMIYMPMGHDVRYLGKELIRFFGHKLGKSATSLILTYATKSIQPEWDAVVAWSMTAVALWGVTMSLLSAHIAERNAKIDIEEQERQRKLAKQREEEERERPRACIDTYCTQASS